MVVVGPGAVGSQLRHAAGQIAAGWSKSRRVEDVARENRGRQLRVQVDRILGAVGRRVVDPLRHARQIKGKGPVGADRQDRQVAAEVQEIRKTIRSQHQFLGDLRHLHGGHGLRLAVVLLFRQHILRAGEHVVRRQGGVIAGLSVVHDGTGEGDGLATHRQRQQGHRDEKPWSEDFHRKILHVDR